MHEVQQFEIGPLLGVHAKGILDTLSRASWMGDDLVRDEVAVRVKRMQELLAMVEVKP